MIRPRFLFLAGVLVLVATSGQPGLAAESVKHPGTIVDIDAGRGRLVLAAVGPWQVRAA